MAVTERGATVSSRGDDVTTGSQMDGSTSLDGLFYCFASIEDTASVADLVSDLASKQPAAAVVPNNDYSPAASSSDNGLGGSWLLFGGIAFLLLLASGFFKFRK